MNVVVHYKKGNFLPIAERGIYDQIKNLREFRSVVYCHGIQNPEAFPFDMVRSLDREKGLAVRAINSVYFSMFDFFPYFGACLSKNRPAVIHSHFGPSGYFFLWLKRYFSLPMVTAFYGYDLSKLPVLHPRWKKRYAKLFRYGELFLVEGSAMKRRLIELGCPENKIILQHIGVDIDVIKFSPRRPARDGAVRVLVCGRFREKKGISYAIEALGLAKKDNPGLNMKMTVIGDSSGCRLEELEKQKIFDRIKKYGLEKDVVMLGEKPYSFFLEEIYRHHIFLSPSVTAADGDTEGGVPVSLIEASASGMPVLSTVHCDIPEVVLNNRSGYLVPERDAAALAEKLLLLAGNPQNWERMGAAGRAHIEQEYDSKKQAKKLEEIYNEAINRIAF